VREEDAAVGEEDAGVGEGTATSQGGSQWHARREGREAREPRARERADGEQRLGMGCAAWWSLASRAGARRGSERGGVAMNGWCDERIRPWRDEWRRMRGRRSQWLSAASGTSEV